MAPAIGGSSSPSGKPPTPWPVHSLYYSLPVCLHICCVLNVFLVEVRVLPTATSRFDTIRNNVHNFLTNSLTHIYLPSVIQGWEEVPLLASSVSRISASESPCPSPSLSIEQISFQIHVYQPSDSDAFEELAGGNSSGDGEEVMAASVCELPSLAWEGLWESLIYADDIKSRLLDYIYATVVFSDANVDCKYHSLVIWILTKCFMQSMSYRGIVLSCFMVPRAQAKLPCVGPLLKNYRYVFLTGTF